MKRIIRAIYLFVYICFCLVCLYGCNSVPATENPAENETITLVVKVKKQLQGDEWVQNEYNLISGEQNTLYLLFEHSEKIEIETNLKVEEDKDAPILKSEEIPNIEKMLPGQYVLKKEYEGYEPFFVKINVLEYRPELTITFDGGDYCVEQKIGVSETIGWNGTLGDSYASYFVYKYGDNQVHYPSITLSYDGKTVYTIDKEKFREYATLKEKDSLYESDEVLEVGYYIFELNIESCIFEGEYKNVFRPLKENIHIRIVNSTD